MEKFVLILMVTKALINQFLKEAKRGYLITLLVLKM